MLKGTVSVILIVTIYEGWSRTHLWPFRKSKFNLMSDRVNLVAPASPIECLPYLPKIGRYSTNWNRKGWPGFEIQMYYGWPCPYPQKVSRRFICWYVDYVFILENWLFLWFLDKRDLRISILKGKCQELLELNNFKPRKTTISSTL